MNLLVDIDGVVCQYDFPKIIKEFYGVSVGTDEIKAYCIEDVLGVSSQSVHHMFLEVCQRPPNFIKGARETLASLYEDGHNIYIYTNRLNFMTLQGLRTWLADNKIVCYAVIKPGHPSKTSFDFHIDDSPTKLMDFNGRTARKLLFSQPWNKACINVTGRLERVYNWAEIEGIVDEAARNFEADNRNKSVKRKALSVKE